MWGIKGILFLIAFLPLYVTPWMVFPYITGKNFAFRILVEFAAVLWLGLLSIDKKYRSLQSPLTISILIFTFVVGLANMLGVSPYNSFWSNYERMEGYITILHLVLYYLMARSVLRSKKDWAVLFHIILLVSVVVSIHAFLTIPEITAAQTRYVMEYGTRMLGTIGNPPFLATYLLLSCFFGFILIFSAQRFYLKFIYSLIIIVNSIAIYFTSSRGAILGAVIGLFIFMALLFLGKSDASRMKRVKRGIIFFAVIFCFVSIVYFIVTGNGIVKQDRTLSRFATMFSDPSVHTRLDTWKIAWEGIKERPILGWGQENFVAAYTVNSIPLVHEHIWLDRAHNIVIDWLIRAGIAGLLSYLAIFVCAYYTILIFLRKKALSERSAYLLFAAFAAYFIQNLFTFDTISSYLLFFTSLAFLDKIGIDGERPLAQQSHSLKMTGLNPAYIIFPAFIVFLLGCYHLNYKPMKVSRVFIEMADSRGNNDTYADLLDDFINILSLETFGDTLVRRGMSSISYSIIKRNLYGHKGAMDLIKRTAEELLKGMRANSFDLKYITDMINFYKAIAVYEPSYIDKTEVLIKESMRMNPEYQWLYMALSDICILKKDYEASYINVKKIVDMDPGDDKRHMKLALAAIYSSREEVVKRSLQNVKNIRMGENENIASGRKSVFSASEIYQIAQVYLHMKQMDKAILYYEELITLTSDREKLDYYREFRFFEPENKARIHFEAANIYSAAGNQEKALHHVQKSVEFDPANFTDKAEKFISSLTK